MSIKYTVDYIVENDSYRVRAKKGDYQGQIEVSASMIEGNTPQITVLSMVKDQIEYGYQQFVKELKEE